jgi:crotonobetaine/carnitine-CoA ligase
VAVILGNHPEHIYTFLALARLGATQIPVNVHLRALGLRYILEHSEARAVIAESRIAADLHEALAGAPAVELVIWRGEATAAGRPRVAALSDVLAAAAPPAPRPAPDPDHTFAIAYTSGTTGPPKGVMMTETMFRAAGWAAGLLADARPGDVFLTWEPLYHIGGTETIVACLLHAVPVALVPRFSASAFWAEARRYRATQIHHLGGIMGILMKQPPRDDDRDNPVRISWGGGAPRQIWEAFEARFGLRIREAYGLTEGASFTTVNLDGKVGSVGRPLPFFEVRVVDDDGRELGPDQVGEIVQRGREPGLLMQGYLKDPDRTAATLRDGWLHTGDLGYHDAAGSFYLVGRKKDSLRRRGENVSAWEVERVVSLHPDVEECAVIGVPSELGGGGDEDIKLFVKPASGARVDPLGLVRFCEQHLAYYQVPRYVEVVEELPKTPSERIRKDALSRSVAGCWDLAQSGYRLRRRP